MLALALNLLVGGWELVGLILLFRHSDAALSGPDPTGTAFTTGRTPANVTNIRPDILRDPNLPADQRTTRGLIQPRLRLRSLAASVRRPKV